MTDHAKLYNEIMRDLRDTRDIYNNSAMRGCANGRENWRTETLIAAALSRIVFRAENREAEAEEGIAGAYNGPAMLICQTCGHMFDTTDPDAISEYEEPADDQDGFQTATICPHCGEYVGPKEATR